MQGWGSLGAPRPGPRMGNVVGLKTARGETSQGGPNLLHRGWIWDCGVRDSPGAALGRCLWDMRVWGRAEGGEEERKGSGRACRMCPVALGRGRVWLLPYRGAETGVEGTAGHRVEGTGLCAGTSGAVSPRLFTGGLGILPALPLVPVKRIIPLAGRQHPVHGAESL